MAVSRTTPEEPFAISAFLAGATASIPGPKDPSVVGVARDRLGEATYALVRTLVPLIARAVLGALPVRRQAAVPSPPDDAVERRDQAAASRCAGTCSQVGRVAVPPAPVDARPAGDDGLIGDLEGPPVQASVPPRS